MFATRSPTTLTELGRRVAEDNRLDGMVDRNWPGIGESLRGLGTSNPYDIQRFCLEATFTMPEKFFTKDDLDRLKFIAYRDGLPLISVTRVVGLLIQDRYFAENGIGADEPDRHAP